MEKAGEVVDRTGLVMSLTAMDSEPALGRVAQLLLRSLGKESSSRCRSLRTRKTTKGETEVNKRIEGR